MLSDMYNSVMDPDANPFRSLPKIVRFQFMMILSFIWSGVFTIWIGASFLMLPAVVGHAALLLAVFFTADVFHRARAMHHRDAMRDHRDGTVLYDDLWGAPTTIEPIPSKG